MLRVRNKYATRCVSINLPVEFETDDASIYFELEDIDVNHSPERPMPDCRDPNKDAYYDPGDPEENEFKDIDDVEKQIRDKMEAIIADLRKSTETFIESLNETDIHELLPKDEI